MFCNKCGKELNQIMKYCPYCGNSIRIGNMEDVNKLYYHLPYTSKRFCDIKVYINRIEFEGSFWYLRNKEFYNNRHKNDIALIKNFLGMGYLKERSYKKCVAFVFCGTILAIINAIMDKLSDLTDKANYFLQLIGQNFSLPEWTSILINVMTMICLILGMALFISKKKVIEISFTDKRICIPRKSLSNAEFVKLYQVLEQLSKDR